MNGVAALERNFGAQWRLCCCCWGKDKSMIALAFFAVGVVSAWAIGMLSRGGLSQNPRTRMWLIFAAISALVGSAAGMVKELVETLSF